MNRLSLLCLVLSSCAMPLAALSLSACSSQIAAASASATDAASSHSGQARASVPRPMLARLDPSAITGCSIADLVEQVRPAVVGITTQREVSAKRGGDLPFFFGGRGGGEQGSGSRIERGIGSGFIIDSSGLVVTNHHVIDGADTLDVRLSDGTVLSATLKGGDAPTDIALLEIVEPPQNLPTVELGDSDGLRVGDCAVAIGDPFGLELTVTRGLISAKAREITNQPYDQFLQTDAAINPGNSGGPLFDMAGRVIGINTAIVASGQGIGFAVPVNLLKALLPDLEKNGRVVRGYLGIVTQTLTPDLAAALETDAEKGALVAQVALGSPAEKAGIETGDLIVGVQGKAVEGASDLSREIAALAPGTRVTLECWRTGKSRQVQVTLDERPNRLENQRQPSQQGGEEAPRLGVLLRQLPESVASELGVSGGALIARVEPGSRAAQAGLRSGDVIVEINHDEVASPSALVQAIRKLGDKAFVLRVFRNGQPAFVAVPQQRR
ncbi:MAG: trypsin-like peptidase domain-containing protein [Myxococcales bacterium]|jgi:serine protease Do|nr:trypsin-like peptidase domain-containing protein [Myxococcales bacterium]